MKRQLTKTPLDRLTVARNVLASYVAMEGGGSKQSFMRCLDLIDSDIEAIRTGGCTPREKAAREAARGEILKASHDFIRRRDLADKLGIPLPDPRDANPRVSLKKKRPENS